MLPSAGYPRGKRDYSCRGLRIKVSNIIHCAISQIGFDFGNCSHRARITRQKAEKYRSGFVDGLRSISFRACPFFRRLRKPRRYGSISARIGEQESNTSRWRSSHAQFLRSDSSVLLRSNKIQGRLAVGANRAASWSLNGNRLPRREMRPGNISASAGQIRILIGIITTYLISNSIRYIGCSETSIFLGCHPRHGIRFKPNTALKHSLAAVVSFPSNLSADDQSQGSDFLDSLGDRFLTCSGEVDSSEFDRNSVKYQPVSTQSPVTGRYYRNTFRK
jgi:hypothetical protein